MAENVDKKALLNELKIQRDAAPGSARPVKWFVAVAVVGGFAFVAWTFGRPLLAAPVVEVEAVAVRALAPSAAGDSVLDATGYVVARRQATVSSKATGKVLEVLIEEGVTVEQGQLLAVLDDSIPRAYLELAESQLAAAKAGKDELRVNIRQAQLDVERTRNLASKQMASQADLDRDTLALQALQARFARVERDIVVAQRQLAIQQRQLEDMRIRAPFGGVVVAKAAQPGEMISPVSAGGGFTRTGICTIVDMGSLEVEVDVNEAYINRVFPDQPATATLNAYPDFAIPARVIATIPAADRNKATVRVRIGFEQRDPRILPDMGVKVAFLEAAQAHPGPESQEQTAAEGPVLLVPKASVVEDSGKHYVWVVEGDAAERREVAIGNARGANLRITDGLRSGERVVARLGAAQLAELRTGASVAVVN